MNKCNSTKLCICINTDKIQAEIDMCQIVQIYNRVMALHTSKNFVNSAQGMNGQNSTKFYIHFDIDKILHKFIVHESCKIFLCSLSRELNNGELNNGNRQNFAYALMLTKSRLTICNIYKTVMTLVLCQRLFSTNSGLQIRGGKGYFSIDFLEFSIEN